MIQSSQKQTNQWTSSVITAFLLAEIVMIAIFITGTVKRTTPKTVIQSVSTEPTLPLAETPVASGATMESPTLTAAKTKNEDIQKFNLLSMTFFGVIVTLLGVALFFGRGILEPYLRYFWALPPIAVASYVFVCNLLKEYHNELPDTFGAVALEVSKATLVCAALFGLMTLALVGLLAVGKKI